ncbi:MAG: acyltransferase domain-containing protein [Isosphaeraceae bacterium]
MSPRVPLDIAIVGMGGRFRGARDLFAYWEDVLAGREEAGDGVESSMLGDAVTDAEADAGLSEGDLNGHRVHRGAVIHRAALALARGEANLAVVADRSPSQAVAMILKRRADAERDGDRIYVVLRELDGAGSAGGRALAADGAAGLVQAALSLYHRVWPPSESGGSPRPWIHAESAVPRRAVVKAVDQNRSIVLEEHAASADAELIDGAGLPGAMLRWESEAILLSAADRAGLADRARELIAWLELHPDEPLKDIAYSLATDEGHETREARLGLVVSSRGELAARLGAVIPRLEDPACRAVGDGRGTYFWDEPLGGSGGLAFLFPGEGSQYPGMLADLCPHFPEVRRLFDTSDRIALEQGDTTPPSEYLFGRPSEADAEIWSAPTAVNVVLSAQWALYQVLTRLGLHPDAVAGHSSGELLALASAGVLRTDRQLERQLAALGMVFRGLESTGDVPVARLLAVAAGRERAEAACLAEGVDGVAVAIDNCPHQVVLAGPPDQVGRVAGHLKGQNILVEDLPFHRAYHTTAFAPAVGPVAAFFERLRFHSPRIPVYSCATREPMPSDPDAIRDLAVAQWTRAVAFRETVERMHADGLRIFVDVGARGNLAGFVQDTLRGRPAFAIAANLPRRGGLTQLNHLVAALFAQGILVQPGILYARRRPRRIESLVSRSRVRQYAAVSCGDGESTSVGVAAPIAAELTAEAAPRPPASRLLFVEEEPEVTATDADAAMLAFQSTMQAFLQTQRTVLEAYLGAPSQAFAGNGYHHESRLPDPVAATSGPEPGPWVGELRRLVPGSEIESTYLLDAVDDPIAEHHTLGGRRVSALDPTLKGLPVLPFAVMAEMAAQAGALVVSPGLVLARLEKLHAHRWVRYEDAPVVLELRGRREPSETPGEERVWVGLFNRGTDGRLDTPRPVFEAVAVFADSSLPPEPAAQWELEDPRTSRFTAGSLYGEQWLFHGSAFQALVQVGKYSAQGIDGVLRVLPWEPLLRPGRTANLHTDLIVLDSFTHLLGCWGLDYLADEGDVVFPLRMEELQLRGGRPPVGTDVACRITIEEVQRHRVRVTAEIVRPDGTVWMRLRDWEDWRFRWPSRYRDVFRQPQDVFIGEELTLDGEGDGVKVVWLASPADMGRPVWRDVLEATQLGPAERAGHLAAGGTESERSHRLWGRIAAKEAARRIWRAAGRAATYPADLAVVDEPGRTILTRVNDPGDRSLPAIAIGQAEGVAVAIAVRSPEARPGIAVATVLPDDDEADLTATERELLDGLSHTRAEWLARFRCAREAAVRCVGTGLDGHPAEIVGAEGTGGALRVRPNSTAPETLLVHTNRRGEFAWAWTLKDGGARS